jgi:hypothetical protein
MGPQCTSPGRCSRDHSQHGGPPALSKEGAISQGCVSSLGQSFSQPFRQGPRVVVAAACTTLKVTDTGAGSHDPRGGCACAATCRHGCYLRLAGQQGWPAWLQSVAAEQHPGHGITQGGRAEWLAEKATELGAFMLLPLETERSHVRRVSSLGRPTCWP